MVNLSIFKKAIKQPKYNAGEHKDFSSDGQNAYFKYNSMLTKTYNCQHAMRCITKLHTCIWKSSSHFRDGTNPSSVFNYNNEINEKINCSNQTK